MNLLTWVGRKTFIIINAIAAIFGLPILYGGWFYTSMTIGRPGAEFPFDFIALILIGLIPPILIATHFFLLKKPWIKKYYAICALLGATYIFVALSIMPLLVGH